MTARADIPYNSFAHSFAGMTVQFILFAGIDAGIVLLLLRQGGIWQRIRSAPVGKADFILARVLATALISAIPAGRDLLALPLAFFGVRVSGSVPGFALVARGFLPAQCGVRPHARHAGSQRPRATRGIAIMVMLLLVMAGGAWVPSFLFPQWLQQISLATPTRWAVDGFDAATWRGPAFRRRAAADGGVAAVRAAVLRRGAMALPLGGVSTVP